MKYYLGPWRWRIDGSEAYWAPPDGFSALDLRPLHEQAAIGGTPGLGIFVGRGDPGKDYENLGAGAWHEVKASQRLRDMLPGKYRPQGDDLLGLILDLFTLGADPDGIEGPKPILPTSRGRIELHCGGRSHYERFAWGDKFTPKVRDVLRRDFARTMAAAEKGDLNDAEHHRRVLDAQCEKYRVSDWTEFVPADLQADVPGRLKHETTVSDNFNRADSTGLGGSWSNMSGSGFDVFSNQARTANATGGTRSRYDSDLSGDDHYTDVDIADYGTNTAASGPLCRAGSGADTCYVFIIRETTSNLRRLFKVVAGAATQLSGDNTAAPSVPATIRVQADGSSQTVYVNGSEATGLAATDTAITGNLRGGMQGNQSTTAADRSILDNFLAADITAGGLLYTQHERSTRGVCRGIYTKY